MSVYKQAFANMKLGALILFFCLMMSMALNFALGYWLYVTPKEQSIYVPPQIPTTGLTLKQKTISGSEVYAFAFYVWQSIQTWPVNGADDYKNNLAKYGVYLTPEFKNVLEREGKQMYNQGFLFDHQQGTFGDAGTSYSKKNVKYIGHGTWLIHLVMRTINRVSPANQGKAFAQSHVVRDAVTSFVFKVVQTKASPDFNPWGLAIAGYAVPPKEIKNFK